VGSQTELVDISALSSDKNVSKYHEGSDWGKYSRWEEDRHE